MMSKVYDLLQTDAKLNTVCSLQCILEAPCTHKAICVILSNKSKVGFVMLRFLLVVIIDFCYL